MTNTLLSLESFRNLLSVDAEIISATWVKTLTGRIPFLIRVSAMLLQLLGWATGAAVVGYFVLGYCIAGGPHYCGNCRRWRWSNLCSGCEAEMDELYKRMK